MELKLVPSPTAQFWQFCLNRTKMELKPYVLKLSGASNDKVLIEPRWNWNFDCPRCASAHPLRVLIEPRWNWNLRRWQEAAHLVMVLIEPRWNWNLTDRAGWRGWAQVLIEPRWNWNIHTTRRHTFLLDRLNRTKMELKLQSRNGYHLHRRKS